MVKPRETKTTFCSTESKKTPLAVTRKKISAEVKKISPSVTKKVTNTAEMKRVPLSIKEKVITAAEVKRVPLSIKEIVITAAEVKKAPLSITKKITPTIVKKSFFDLVDKSIEIKKVSPEVRELHKKLNEKFHCDFGPIYLNVKENKIIMQCLCVSIAIEDLLKEKFSSMLPGIKYLQINIPPHGHLLTMQTDLTNFNVLLDAMNAFTDKGNKEFDDKFFDTHVEFRSHPLIPKKPLSIVANKPQRFGII